MNDFIIVRGSGDIATGVIYALHNAGLKVLALEVEKPSSIRRLVSLSECIYENTFCVENVNSIRVSNLVEIENAFAKNLVPVLVDPNMDILNVIKPKIIVDAVLAKKNLGLNKDLADLVIALGPPFTAKVDCDIVIETNRGHDLGRIILDGQAEANTGVPGSIQGFSDERVMYSENEGTFKVIKPIKSIVKKDEVIGEVDGVKVLAKIDGVLRGIIRDGFYVTKGFKIADIDPRISEVKNCDTISDKARCIGGSVLVACLQYGGIK